MKKIYYLLLALLVTGFTFTACSDEDPFETVSESDFPMILDPVFPDRGSDGSLPIVATLNRDQTYELTARVTPSEYTTVKWYVDGVEVLTGLEFSALFKAGTYNLKVVATSTNGLSSYREGTLQVDPLDTDPSTTTGGIERIVAAGGTARLNGTNLNLVQYVVVDGQICPATYNEDGSITYTVPEGLADGEYRILLGDYNGVEYGGNTITVSSGTLVMDGASSAVVGEEWVLTGTGLDQVTSLTVGDLTINSADFLSQTVSEIVLNCPELEAGSYTLTGQTTSGALEFYTTSGNVTEMTLTINAARPGETILWGALEFYTTSGNVTEMTLTINAARPGETILWQGHHYVSWETPDGDPNHQFTSIDISVFESIEAGSTMTVAYSLKQDDEYHQVRIATANSWANLVPDFNPTEDGEYSFTLTQELLDRILNENGFLISGHGFYIDKVSVFAATGGSGLPWTGHLSISWESPENDPGHMFNVVPDLMPLEELQVGDVFHINYSIVEAAEYHSVAIATVDWAEPYFVREEVTEAGTYNFEITEEVLNEIQAKGGFIIIGHGFYLDMVSVE